MTPEILYVARDGRVRVSAVAPLRAHEIAAGDGDELRRLAHAHAPTGVVPFTFRSLTRLAYAVQKELFT